MIYTILIYDKIETFASLDELKQISELRKKISNLETEISKNSIFDLYNNKISSEIDTYNWMNKEFLYLDPESDIRAEMNKLAQEKLQNQFLLNNENYRTNTEIKPENINVENSNINTDNIMNYIQSNERESNELNNKIDFYE